MELFDHQKILVDKCSKILSEHNLCYLAAEERVGKTLSALHIMHKCGFKFVCIVTKKAAIPGWLETIENAELPAQFIVSNFEQMKKFNGKVDAFIIDEAHHTLAAYPRPSKTAQILQNHAYEKPILFCSATPCAQSFSQLFHQLNISKYSPWDSYTSFYRWFDDYGILKTQYIAGHVVKKYDETKKELFDGIFKKYFVFMTRKEAGFNHNPQDQLHYVELSDITKQRIHQIEKNGVLEELNFNATNAAHKLVAIHQLEGGTLKEPHTRAGKYIEGCNIDLSNEKIQYILATFGDSEDIVIFYNYLLEEMHLRKYFKKARILQATKYAEGVDLSMHKTVIIYSMNFSTAKYIQRRARQCNKQREDEIVVHFMLAKGAVSEYVYKCVAEKNKNFTSAIFQKESGIIL